MKVLNESCKFQCAGNPSILITAQETENLVAKDRRKKILTKRAKCHVTTPLPCSFLTASAGGTPTPCQLVQGSWQGTEKKITCKGKEILTEKSYFKCPHGGIVKPVSVSCTGTSSIGKGVAVIDLCSKCDAKHTEKTNAVQSKSQLEVKTDQKETILPTSEKQAACDRKEMQKKSENIYASHTMCNYEECKERENCEYFNSQIYVENDSLKLSKNFQANRKQEWEDYLSLHKRKIEESSIGEWRIAAHHIVSGNQVLMMKNEEGELLYGVLVKLANYFGYDVNNEWNCIMLPTNQSNFGDMEQIHKLASAYDVMWLMGRQWHVGGHQYSLSEDTLKKLSEYYQKHPEEYPILGTPEFFSNYRTAMKEEMDKLLMKYSRPQCWKKNYKKKRQKFFDDMNGVSKKVERYLLSFKENPRKSFPFFVSKVAVEYAYDLPSTVKIMVIYEKDRKFRAKKVRMERYMKNELKIIPIEKDDIEITDDKSFILFCENVMYFIIDEKAKGYKLPFRIVPDLEPVVRNIDLHGKSVMEYLLEHGNEIMAFVNQNVYAYQPIHKMILARGGA